MHSTHAHTHTHTFELYSYVDAEYIFAPLWYYECLNSFLSLKNKIIVAIKSFMYGMPNGNAWQNVNTLALMLMHLDVCMCVRVLLLFPSLSTYTLTFSAIHAAYINTERPEFARKKMNNIYTHMYTQRERKRERERGASKKNWQPVATKEWNLLQWIHYTVNCFTAFSFFFPYKQPNKKERISYRNKKKKIQYNREE